MGKSKEKLLLNKQLILLIFYVKIAFLTKRLK